MRHVVVLGLVVSIVGCGRVDVTGSDGAVDAAGHADATVADATVADATVADAMVVDAEPASDMITVPAGSFAMGCLVRFCPDQELPYHNVMVSEFRIDRTEVTQADYEECVQNGACTTPASDYNPTATPHRPVHAVSWLQAHDYCVWRGKRLPTEAEWEKAARGTDSRIYPWGNEAPTCERVIMTGCSDEPVDVGGLPTGNSYYGVENMGGNVEEWVADWFSATYYQNSPATDPTGPASGDVKVTRGGAYGWTEFQAQCAWRVGRAPTEQDPLTGFRCAQSP